MSNTKLNSGLALANPSKDVYTGLVNLADQHGDGVVLGHDLDSMKVDANTGSLESQLPVLKKVVASAKARLLAAQKMGPDDTGLFVLLTGECGTGKTHTAKAMATGLARPEDVPLKVEIIDRWHKNNLGNTLKRVDSDGMRIIYDENPVVVVVQARLVGGNDALLRTKWQSTLDDSDSAAFAVVYFPRTGGLHVRKGFSPTNVNLPTGPDATVEFPNDGLHFSAPIGASEGVFVFSQVSNVNNVLGSTLFDDVAENTRPMAWILDDLGRNVQNDKAYWLCFSSMVEAARRSGSLVVATSNLPYDAIIGKIDVMLVSKRQSALDLD